MNRIKNDNYIWQVLLAAFLLSGVLHVVLYGVSYMDAIVQIFDGMVLLCWLATILRRIVDRRVRNLLVSIVALMMLYFAIQMCKYRLFSSEEATALRLLWYCFYIPMTLIPLVLFFLSVFMNRAEGDHSGKKYYWLLAPALLLLVVILTNDWHTLVFRFPDGIAGNTGRTGTYTLGPMYFVTISWEMILVILALVNFMRKCGTYAARKSVRLPALTLLIGGILYLLIEIGCPPRVHGVTVWQLTETYMFTFVLFLEGCIRIGMLPANSDYEKMFVRLQMPAAIYDTEGRNVVCSAGAFEEDNAGALLNTASVLTKEKIEDMSAPDSKTETMEVPGGRAAWVVDLKNLNSLNRQIMEVTGQIESRNERLLSENQMKEEQAALDARNNLYDQIAHIVKPQLGQIEAMMKTQLPADFDRTIAKINVLNAYIKRRSNMELLKADTGRLPVSELVTAIRESMEYLKDTGVSGSVSAAAREELPSELVILAYELFEQVLERCLDTAKMAAVFLNSKDGILRIRVMIENEKASDGDTNVRQPLLSETYQNPNAGFFGSVEEEREAQERIFTITLQEGGAV